MAQPSNVRLLTENTLPGWGNRTVFLGDSNTIYLDTPTQHGEAWPVYACAGSMQRIYYVRNAGVGGDTSAQMLARYSTDVAAYDPNVVVIMAGTNEITGSMTTWKANIAALVAATRAIGAMPVLCTLLPKTGNEALIILWNTWLKEYTATEGITLLDMFGVAVDETTGTFKTAYALGDGIHLNAAGHVAAGAYVAAKLAPLLPEWSPPLAQTNGGDTYNLAPNPLFLGTVASEAPPGGGWYIDGNLADVVGTLETGATVKGQWWKGVVANNAAQVSLSTGSLTIVAGHTYYYACRVQLALTAGSVRFEIATANGTFPSFYSAFDLDGPIADGILVLKFTAAASTTIAVLQHKIAAGSTGTVRVGQVTFYDLTAMGLTL